MTNSDIAPEIPHQNFKDIAPFGKSVLSEITFKEGNDYVRWPLRHDTLEKNFMSIWYLFHLHVQTIVLEAFIQRIYWKFYPLNIHHRIQTIIEDQLKNFSTNQPDNDLQNFSLFSDSVDKLREGIVSAVKNNYLTPAETGTLILDDDEVLEHVKEKLRDFNDIINLQLNDLQKKLTEIQSDTHLAYDMMKYCLNILQKQHEEGWKLACAFFEYSDNKEIPMALVFPQTAAFYNEYRDQGEKQMSESLKTWENASGFPPGERCIKFTFSPQRFLTTEFLRLPLEFFHEYISHLDECIYSKPTSTAKRPSESEMIAMDEGWMMYVAQGFFDENGESFLGHTYQDLIRLMKGLLGNWIHKMTYHDAKNGSILYNRDADLGLQVAYDFLKFLQELPATSKDAKMLFYRLSFNLITRYPTNKRWHSDFIRTLGIWLKLRKEKLIEIIPYDAQTNSILLDTLWLRMKEYPPKSSTISSKIS